MAKKNDNKLLIAAAVAVGGYLLYKHMNAPTATAVPVATPVTTDAGTVIQQAANAQTNAAAQPIPQVAGAYDPSVMNWAQSALKPGDWARFQAVDSAFSPDEWIGLYRLVNADPKYGFGTQGGGLFWDQWRVKYHIDDGTY